MASLPGSNIDVFFGDAEQPLPDWRKVLPDDDSDDDELTPAERASVVAMLGFDPALWDTDARSPTRRRSRRRRSVALETGVKRCRTKRPRAG
jgi:hypothetical protein